MSESAMTQPETVTAKALAERLRQTMIDDDEFCWADGGRERVEAILADTLRAECERLRAERDEVSALVKEASEIMQITYAGNFPAGIESFLIRAARAPSASVQALRKALEDKVEQWLAWAKTPPSAGGQHTRQKSVREMVEAVAYDFRDVLAGGEAATREKSE